MSSFVPSSDVAVLGVGQAPELPCPICGAWRTDGPEKERWLEGYHCWQCGYHPDSGINLAPATSGTLYTQNQVAALIQAAAEAGAQKALEAR